MDPAHERTYGDWTTTGGCRRQSRARAQLHIEGDARSRPADPQADLLKTTQRAVLAGIGQFAEDAGQVVLGHGVMALWALLEATRAIGQPLSYVDHVDRLGLDGLSRLLYDDRVDIDPCSGAFTVTIGELAQLEIEDVDEVCAYFEHLASELRRLTRIPGERVEWWTIGPERPREAKLFMRLAEEERFLRQRSDADTSFAELVKPLPSAAEIGERIVSRLRAEIALGRDVA
jgi:hypothetical protein